MHDLKRVMAILAELALKLKDLEQAIPIIEFKAIARNALEDIKQVEHDLQFGIIDKIEIF